MNNIVHHLSLKQSFKVTSNLTRSRAIKLWLVAHLLIPPSKRGYVYLSHAYLRWVDDFIDDPLNSISSKRKLLSNQFMFLQRIKSLDDIQILTKEEQFLYYLLKYFLDIGEPTFISCIYNILKSFEMDVNRLETDGMFSKAELQKYLKLLNESIFKISFCFVPINRNKIKVNNYIGNYFWHILAIRDFNEDIDAGFINIVREDVEKYDLDCSSLLKDNRRFSWLEDHYINIQQILNAELNIMSKMPLLLKILWGLSFFYFSKEFLRIRFYNYRFGLLLPKELNKEVKILVSSVWMRIQIFVKIFL